MLTVVIGAVGGLLHLFFTDWLHSTSRAVVASMVVGSTVPRLAPGVSGSGGPGVCGPAMGSLLDLGVGDLKMRPDPSDCLRVGRFSRSAKAAPRLAWVW